MRILIVVSLTALFAAAPASAAWQPGPERYGEGVTTDLPVKMRDGTVLRADVHYPTNPDGTAAAGPFPVLLSETPYGKEAAGSVDILAGHRPYLVKRGYIQAIVDVRGQGSSEGSFQLLGPDEQADSVEAIKWAAALPHSTGKVGMTGESYLGIVQMFAAAAVGRHSPLKAIFPIVTANDPYRDLLTSGGVLNIESSLPLAGAYGGLAIANPFIQAGIDPQVFAQYQPLLADRANDIATGFSAPTTVDILSGGDRAYEGTYWGDHRRPADVLRDIVRNHVPAYLVGGLYDVFQRGEPLNFAGLQNAWAGRAPWLEMRRRQRVTGRYQLLMKPQYHSTVDNGEPNLDPIQLAWFDHWLKGVKTGIVRTRTPLHLVEAGGTKREAARFPLNGTHVDTLRLGAGGTLGAKPTADGSDTVAFTGASLPCDRSLEQWALGAFEIGFQAAGFHNPCADKDIVPASAGPGQLEYTTAPLARDTTLAGPAAATLYASANTKDTEWVVKLSDVAPDGTSVDLTQGALLGSHRALDAKRTWRARNGLPILPFHPHTKAAKQPVTPGKVTRYDVEIRTTFATLKAGHRLRLTVLTSQSPHLLPLPEDLANLAGGVYQVQRTAAAPSSLQVPLLH